MRFKLWRVKGIPCGIEKDGRRWIGIVACSDEDSAELVARLNNGESMCGEIKRLRDEIQALHHNKVPGVEGPDESYSDDAAEFEGPVDG